MNDLANCVTNVWQLPLCHLIVYTVSQSIYKMIAATTNFRTRMAQSWLNQKTEQVTNTENGDTNNIDIDDKEMR